MNSKNILLVSQFFSGGGLERMVHLLGASLSNDFSCNVTHFSFEQKIDEKTMRAFETQYRIKGVSLKKTNGFSFQVLFKIIQIVLKNKIDVIHTNETAALMYASIAKIICFFLPIKKFRLIHTQHSFIHLQSHQRLKHYDRFFSKFANVVTVVSEKLQKEYEEIGISLNKIKVIPNGVELPTVSLNAEQKKAERILLANEILDEPVRLQLQKHLDHFWILNLARIHPKKGQDNVIKVWKELAPELREKSVLLFVGPETFEGEKNRLLELVKSSPNSERVLFLGNTNTPIRWMQAANLYISASEYEGMPLSPFEAIGAGIPTILSDIAGHLTLKDLSTQYDFKVPKKGAEMLSHWLNLQQNSRLEFDAINKKNAESVHKNFSIQRMSENYYQLYYPVQKVSSQLK